MRFYAFILTNLKPTPTPPPPDACIIHTHPFSLSLSLSRWVPVTAAVSAQFLDFSYREYFSVPSSFFLTERSQRIVSENYRSKHIRKRRMWMRISRAWQRERGFIFFHEAGAVVGHLTETEICILCRASELYFGSPVHQVQCAAPLNFIYALLIVIYAAPVAPHPKSKDGRDVSHNLHPSALSLHTSFLTLDPSCLIDLLI